MFNWFKNKDVYTPPVWRIVQGIKDYSIQESIYVGEGDSYWVKHSDGYETADEALAALNIIRNPKIIYV